MSDWVQEELDRVEQMGEQARAKMRALAQELAAEFAQQLQQEMASQTGAVMAQYEAEDGADQGYVGQVSGGGLDGQGWLSSAFGAAFNQVITRVAQGKSLSSKAAITAIMSQPARQLGTQWGKMFADGGGYGYSQLRFSDAQAAGDLWNGLVQGMVD